MAINEREGLFSPCSEWIWLFEAPECNCYGQFQRSFRPAQAQGRVKLHISAEGHSSVGMTSGMTIGIWVWAR